MDNNPPTPLEEFCRTPRKLIEIVDHFSGMEEELNSLSEKDEHLRKMRTVCTESLYDTFHRGWKDFNLRNQNTRTEHQNEHVAPLARRFLEKANELLNKFAPTVEQYKRTFQYGPIVFTADGRFDANLFLQTYYSKKEWLKQWLRENGHNSFGSEDAKAFQGIFAQLRGDDWADFQEQYNTLFFEPYPRYIDPDEGYTDQLDAAEFMVRYCQPEDVGFNNSRIGHGGLKRCWDYVRFSKPVDEISPDIPPAIQDKVTVQIGLSRDSGTSFINIKSEYVQKYMHQMHIVEQYRALIATAYQERVPAIVNNIIQHVECGILEVANEYSQTREGRTPHAHFMFATRMLTTRIRVYDGNNNDIPFGTLVVKEEQSLHIIHQRIKDQKRLFGLSKPYNMALRSNQTRQKFHGFDVRLELAKLVPYYTPRYTYKNQKSYMHGEDKQLDSIVNDEVIEVNTETKNDDDFSDGEGSDISGGEDNDINVDEGDSNGGEDYSNGGEDDDFSVGEGSDISSGEGSDISSGEDSDISDGEDDRNGNEYSETKTTGTKRTSPENKTPSDNNKKQRITSFL